MKLKKRYTLIGVLSSYLTNYPGGKQFLLFYDNVLSPHVGIFSFLHRECITYRKAVYTIKCIENSF